MLPTLPENEKKQTLFSRDFILLFCMAMCNNSYMAVFYCFEQWLEGLQVSPNWRGILLSALFAIMLAYPFIHGPDSIWLILGLRIAQGISLAVYSSCVVAVLVSCIPKGQSARGFAIFSLTTLLPYSIIPAVGEQILPLLGGEPRLFALMAVLAIPALCMLVPLAPKLRKPEISADTAKNQMTPRAILYSMTHSGLGCIYLACLSFSIMTALAIYFMKGLCVTTGATPAMFFMGYTTTIILVRLFGGHVLDTLPRYRIVPLCAVALAISMTGLAWGPLWAFLPLTILYGIGLGLLYPLLAATIYDRSTDATRSINSNVMMLTFDASGMLGPLLGGAVIHAGFGYRGVFMAAAFMVLCSGGFMVLDRLRLALWDRREQRK